jgi:hypothetical protein
MPLLYINPAKRRSKKSSSRRRIKISVVRAKARRKKRKAAGSRRRKDRGMARRLYGAAAKAHAKKLSRMKRRRKRKNPRKRARRHAATVSRRRVRRRRRRNPAAVAAAPASNPRRRRRRRRRNPSQVAANPRRRRRRRRRNSYLAVANPRRRRRRRRNPSRSLRRTASGYRYYVPNARRRRRRRRNPSAPLGLGLGMRFGAQRGGGGGRKRRGTGRRRRTGLRTLSRARRSIKRYRRLGGLGGWYIRKHRMRTNPAIVGELMSVVRAAAPVALAVYLSRTITSKVGPMVPGLDKLGAFARPATALGVVAIAHFGTKRVLQRFRTQILIGAGINLVDALVSAFAPAEVKSMFGVGDHGLYDRALSEYVGTSDYVGLNQGEPIDDDIALSDYVSVDGVSEELGAMQEELGLEEDLGALREELGDDRLGGVSQGTLMRAVPQKSFVAPVPSRSFTRGIMGAGPGFDNENVLYTGIFSGGFGR